MTVGIGSRPARMRIAELLLRAAGDRADLCRRIDATRLPDDAPHAGWRYGVGEDDVRELLTRWRSHDWSATLHRLSRFPHRWTPTALGDVHVMRVPARDTNAPTVVLVHGWPSSFIEMERLAVQLAVPTDDAPAFNVLVPSLPGFALSSVRPSPGPNHAQMADALATAISQLGADAVYVHAYDIAAATAVRLAQRHPSLVRGYHTTEPGLPQLSVTEHDRSDPERKYLAMAAEWENDESGYLAQQATRPHTLAYGLSDSPAGLAAWLFEKWHNWTVSPSAGWNWDSPLAETFLDTLSLYWTTNSIASANRAYFRRDVERDDLDARSVVEVPVSVTLTAQEIERAPRELAERLFRNIVAWNDAGVAGHFVCAEQPSLVAGGIRRLVAA
jgi:pimeloyl-ACP methyl ester carboxylesterase